MPTETKIKVFRQGDVVLIQSEMPPNAKADNKEKVLAYGEVTGHAHRISDQGIIFQHPATKRRFLRIITGGLSVTHEEHEDLNLPEGDYEIKQQREWDWYSEEVRRVQD